jgi:curved DNA-binding protein CbpA
LLRVTRSKAIKAVFFDNGAPVFAISNLANEQLERKLVKDAHVSPDQIEQAKQQAGKANRLGAALVEMGALSEEQMRTQVREQVTEIILSLFEWTDGDYAFDERIRASHEVTLQISATDMILDGARRAAADPAVAEILAPSAGLVSRARSGTAQLDSGRLVPIESYILSRIDSPTPVSDVGMLSGISDEDARRAICALVAAGFLKVAGREAEDKKSEPGPDDSLDRLREEVTRRLHFYVSADYYEVLEITRQASASEIKAAYYKMAKRFHPDRYHQPEHAELRGKLEALFSMITQAYETLHDSRQRSAYDERLRRPDQQVNTRSPYTTSPFKTTPLVPPSEAAASPAPASQDDDLSNEVMAGSKTAPQHNGSGSLNAAAEPVSPDPQPQRQAPPNGTPPAKPAQSAEQCYRQGRACFDRKEYHLAVHLLREAVKLDPSKAAYHYHLGSVLIRSPRTRHEAEEHLLKAAELEPYNAQIKLKLGLMYKEAGLAKKAQIYFREALQIDPDNKGAKREMAQSAARGKGAQAQDSIWKSDLGSIAKRIFKR